MKLFVDISLMSMLAMLQIDGAGNYALTIICGFVGALLAFFAGRYVLGIEKKQRDQDESIRKLYGERDLINKELAKIRIENKNSELRQADRDAALIKLIHENGTEIRNELGKMGTTLAIVKNELLKSGDE